MFTLLKDFYELLSLAWHFRIILWQRAAFFEKEENADLFCRLLKDRGAFFIKLGQWAAQRTDIGLPQLFYEKLKEMQTDAPKHSWQETLQVCKPFDLSNIEFEDKDPTTNLPVPIKSGSIAQVYRVQSTISNFQHMQEGKFIHIPADVDPERKIRFAFKVCHPGVAEMYSKTLRIIKNIYLILQWYMGKNSLLFLFNIHEVITQEFQRQTNMICEAEQCLKIREDFGKNPYANVPFPCFASENFFFLQYIENAIFYDDIGVAGKDPTFYANDRELQETKMLAKQMTLAAFFQMVLYNGRSHGDCHAGNILYRLTPKDRSVYLHELEEMQKHHIVGRPLCVSPASIQVFFIDFGIVVDISKEFQNTMIDLTVSINACDSRLMAKTFEKFLVDRDQMPTEKLQAFRHDCDLANERLCEKDRIGPGTTLQDQIGTILETFRKHRLCLDTSALRVIISWLLIDANTPVYGREDNLPDNTIRWISAEDIHDYFHLHEITSFIIGARESRILKEKARENGINQEYQAPNLDFLRSKQQNRREQAHEMLQILETPKDETTPKTVKTEKKRRIKLQ